MPEILLGIVVLVLLLWAVNSFSKADPKQAARVLRGLGGGAALLFAGFLMLRGEIGVAVPVGLFGLGLLGWVSLWPATFGARTQKSTGQISRVRTAFLEMELDHDSGTMRGRVVAGRHQGVSLDTMDRATLINLFGEIDGDSRELLAAYLDRRDPGWRQHAQGDAAAGSGRSSPRSSGKMTEEEAYQILGIQPGASTEDITRAHRSLMKKLHPDQGGTTYLAARVNEAKDVLLRRHR
jgi:DnaJ-like protein